MKKQKDSPETTNRKDEPGFIWTTFESANNFLIIEKKKMFKNQNATRINILEI